MHWIVQNNLHREHGHIQLIDFLTKMDIPFTEVKVVPFSYDLPLEERMEPFVNPPNPVMISGSVALAHAAKTAGWIPGSFHNENHDYQVWKQHYGNHLLNADAIVCRFSEVIDTWDEFFIRPCGDTKSFSGLCLDWEEFKLWKHKILDLKEYYTTVDENTMVMYGPIKQIYREARFFIVDGKVVTYSTYKIGSSIIHVQETPPTMIEYAERMVDIWQPARAFVIDIALTDDADDGYNKIIEINGINCSGFYEIDIQKFVMAIEEMDFSKEMKCKDTSK